MQIWGERRYVSLKENINVLQNARSLNIPSIQRFPDKQFLCMILKDLIIVVLNIMIVKILTNLYVI